MKKFTLISIVTMLFFCGCLNSPAKETVIYDSHRIERYIDKEAGVVCWAYTAPFRGGIHCMPIKDTDLQTVARLH